MEVTEQEGGSKETKPSVLFLDDEEMILASLRSILRREGYDLHLYSSAGDALAFLTSHKVDIVISDMKMSSMSGAEFLDRVSRILPSATRIIFSASENKQIVLGTVASGLAQHYILKPWDDTLLKTLLRDVLSVNREIIESNLQSILPSVRDLPAAPVFSEKLHTLLSAGESSLGDIAEEISKLPVVVARILKIVNSVYFSTRQPIVSIRDAILFIGVEQLSMLVLGVESFQCAAGTMEADHLSIADGIWNTSIQRAVVARKIATSRAELKGNSAIHIASLLLDIGLVLRLSNQPKEFDSYLQLVRDTEMFPYEAERRVFGAPHDIVGKALLDYWNIPSSIGDIIARSHALTAGDSALEVVQIADVLSNPGQPSAPHDPSIMPFVDEWREKIHDAGSNSRK